jgi:hypothetical protein
MPELSPQLAAVLEKLPADEYPEARELMEQILSGGPVAIRQLIAAVGDEFGHPPGTPAQYALHGLAHYVARPGAAAQRAMVAETLASDLAATHPTGLTAFLCRQLQYCGRAEEVPALTALLDDDQLREPAAQALQAIA